MAFNSLTDAWFLPMVESIGNGGPNALAQFDGIAINIWKNRKVNSDVNIMCQKPPMGQFDGIIKNIWKNRKVHSDEKLYVLNFT